MQKDREWLEKDSSDFFDAVGTLAAGAKVFTDGVRYVEDVEFWKWLTTDVVRAPLVNDLPLPLSDADAIKSWINARIKEEKGHYIQHLLQNRGAEFDFVRDHQHDPIEFLKGNRWRMATPFEDCHQGIDSVRRNIFTGSTETHQIKAGLSDTFRKVDLSKYAPAGPKPVDVVDVNEKIHNWRHSENGRECIANRGDAHPAVKSTFSDDKLRSQAERRQQQASSGNAVPHVTFEGVATQVGRGALIGAVVAVGASTLSNYRRYRRGEIDGSTFGELLLEDSARGALTGGAIAAVNIPVQLSAFAMGVGNPITIPVMMLVGAGLRQFIDPMFGRGAYGQCVNEASITRDVAEGVARFALQCQAFFEDQRVFLQEIARLHGRGVVLNRVSTYTDSLLADAIAEI